MFDDKDYLELPDVDEDKKRREKIYNKVEKILDKSGIKYDAPKEKVRKFIDNQISLNGNYELFISVKGDENLPKICSAINKEIAELNGHVARDNYNFLVLTCESAMSETFLKSTLIKNYKPKGYISLNNFTKIEIDKYNYKKYKFNSDIYYYNKDRENIIWVNEKNEVVCLLVINKKSDPNHIWISQLEVNEKYLGYNLGNQVLEYAIFHMGANALRVMYDNEVAKRMYEKHGFIVSDESKKEVKEGKSKSYIMYLNHSINETSFKSKFKYGYKSKYYIPLSRYKEVKIYESNYNHYKSQSKVLSHLNPLSDIRIWIDIEHDNNIVAIAAVDNTLRPGCNWITALEVNEEYRGHKLGKQILDYAVVNMGGNALGVKYDNEVAKHMYEKYGFKISQKSIERVKNKETSAYHMYYESSINEFNIFNKRKKKTKEEIERQNKIIKERNTKIINVIRPIINKLNNDPKIKKIIQADIDEYMKECPWDGEAIYYKNNGISKFSCSVFSYHESVLMVFILNDDIATLVPHTMEEIVTTIRNDKSMIKLIDELGIKSIDTDDGYLFFNFYDGLYESSIDELELPDKADYATDINELLNITNHSRVFLTSDWHLFANHYDHDSKGINKQKIISWCKSNIKDNDVFIYLGDISYRYANDTDIENAKKIMKSIPGIKVLVLGNHDKMLGDEFYAECGFTLVYDSFEWNEIIFTHRPINMAVYPSRYWNIHGHIHDRVDYYTMEGDHNINVYPSFYDNKPVTLEYIINHKEELVKNHYWNKEMSGFFTEAANTNKPIVYYCDKINSDVITYMTALFSDRLKGRIAIKLHVGEEGNQNALKPNLLKGLVKYTHGTFVDSNVAYESKRATTEGHKETAEKHGFTKIAYFDVLDADGDMVIQVPYQNQINKALKNLEVKGTEIPVITPGHHLKEVNVGAHLSSYDSMIVYTHFKGHTMAGYGGAVKNIGMGIPSGKVGKIQVHGKSFRRTPDFLERLVEAAAAVEDYFNGHIVYINVLKNISVDCDCDAVAHKPTIPDIGILVSDNLYAIEQASLDLIRNMPHNKDIMERIASRGGVHQLEYMKLLGMDSDGYILKDLNNRRIKLENTIIDETKRSELPDSAFGIPEDRKYPLDTEQHVRSAIKLFGHAEESKKKVLAQRIRTAAKKYDLSIPENTQCYKYLNEGGLEEMIPIEVHNIIFDLHGTIIGDDILPVLENGLIIQHHYAHDIADILVKIFDNTDLRHYSTEQIRDYYVDIAPDHYKKYADKIFYELLPKMINKYPYTDELLDRFKSKGYKLYYLSNCGKYAYDVQQTFFVPLLNKFDGGLFDHQSRYTKPQKEFFLDFLKKYNIKSESCLFIDNMAENTAAAESIGMHTILFDKENTPKILLSDKYEIPPNANSMLIVDNGVSLENVSVNDFDCWLIESFNDICEDYTVGIPWIYSDFDTEVQEASKLKRFNDEYKNNTESYAFIRGKDNQPILVGQMYINEDASYEWTIQYPIKLNEDGTYSSSVKSINEWAMAACNPIVGIHKPFVLKISNDNGSIINTKQYALAPDIIADKYFVVNENAKIELVDSSMFKDCYIEAYECTLNKLALNNRLNKINKAYRTNQTVDTTVFYTMLAGKPMLTEDQIDFDNKFKKVDFELMKENALTKLSTIISEFYSILMNTDNGIWVPVTESKLEDLRINTILAYKTNRYKDICIREDMDGYYAYCELTKLRSRSVKNINEITDQMMESILNK